MGIYEFQMALGLQQQGVGKKINLKTYDGWKWNFLSGKDNTL